MIKYLLSLTLALIFFQTRVNAQNVTPKKGSYGIDESNQLIVWHVSDLDSVQTDNNRLAGITFDKTYQLIDTLKPLSYREKYAITAKGKTFDLYISRLPIVHLQLDTVLNESTKVLGRYTFYNRNRLVSSGVGIEYRGNLSLTYPKKTYDLEFWRDSIQNNSKDIQFEDLRNDDDWVLDGLYNEPLRLRSFIASNLWKAIHSPNYLSKEQEAKSGADLVMVEVFINGQYRGIFTLSESVDRKLLGLRKNENQTIRGELFKASSYKGAPSFQKAPGFNNVFPDWAGFEMEYPILDYNYHWDDVSQLVKLVVTGTNTDFNSSIEQKIDLKNAMDYFLFVNLLRATDNLGKNYYLARYDENDPYFFVPWDLDGVMGIIQDGKRIPTTDDILSNGLFERLLETNPNRFKEKLKERWFQLRQDQFSQTRLLDTIEAVYSQLEEERVYEREYRIWPNKGKVTENYAYLKSWLKRRLSYLDIYFDGL